MVTTYYWRGVPNFGDLLGPLLLEHFAGLPTTWAPAATCDLISVGSNLHLLPREWAGVVAGAGKLKESTVVDLPRATILGVRGPLSAQGLGDVAIGDPGLLADELVQADKLHPLGLVPHWSDLELEHRPEFARYNPIVIRPGGDPLEVLRAIGSCRKIVASSLHGIIVADAFGIPRRIEMAARFAGPHEGADYKFRDHNAAVEVPHRIGVTQTAPRYAVQDRRQEVFDMLRGLRALYPGGVVR